LGDTKRLVSASEQKIVQRENMMTELFHPAVIVESVTSSYCTDRAAGNLGDTSDEIYFSGFAAWSLGDGTRIPVPIGRVAPFNRNQNGERFDKGYYRIYDDLSGHPNDLGEIGLWHGPLLDQGEVCMNFVLREQDNAELGFIEAIAITAGIAAGDLLFGIGSGIAAAVELASEAAAVGKLFAAEIQDAVEGVRTDKVVGGFALVIRNVDGGPTIQWWALDNTLMLGDGTGMRESFEIEGHRDRAYDYRDARYRLTVRIDTPLLMTNSQSGRCVDVPLTDTQVPPAGTLIQQYSCHGGLNQRWLFWPVQVPTEADDDVYATYYQIINAASGFCLDVPGFSRQPGEAIQYFGTKTGPGEAWNNQLWQLLDKADFGPASEFFSLPKVWPRPQNARAPGEHVILGVSNSLCLEVPTSTSLNDHAPIQQNLLTAEPNQLWYIYEYLPGPA
jgi:Ricin-type beta-trefoil lectin domain-like